MKKSLFSIIFIFASIISVAQNTDSLWKIYNDKTKADTNRVNAIHDIARSYINNNPDTAIILAEQELKLANSISINKANLWTANALNVLGIAYSYKGNYSKALEYYAKTLDIYK